MNKEKVIYSCDEHMEMAIDDFVNNVELAPTIEKCEDKKCDYCANNSAIKIAK